MIRRWAALWRSFPLIGLIGFYYLIKAHRRWIHEPYLSTKTSFTFAIVGTVLIALQGWHSYRQDWQPLLELNGNHHLLGSRRWWLAIAGLIIGVGATWQGIIHEQFFSSMTIVGWIVALLLVVATQIPRTYWQSLYHRTPRPDLNWHVIIPIVQWMMVIGGVSYCLYVGWRADLRQTNAVRIVEMWWLGISITLVGLVPLCVLRDWFMRLWRSFRHDYREWLVVLGLTALALVVRVAWLETNPYIQAEDEAAFAIQAVDLVGFSHWIDSPFRFGVWHHPLIYHMMISASVETLGQTILASRLPSALLGTFTVPAVYLMGRRMFNWRVGLVAAVWMVTFPVHLHFSRISINQVGDPLFTAFTFAFLTQALRTGDEMEYALAGVSLGLSQYFYSASRIVPILIVGYVLFYALANRRWIWQRGDLVLIAVILSAVVAFPVYYSVYQDKTQPLNPRLEQVAIFETGDIEAALAENRWEDYWKYQFQHSYGAYVQRVDESGFYGAYNSLVGWFGITPFLIGIALGLRRYYDPRWATMVIWVALTGLLGGVLLVDPPHYPRFVSVMPGLAVLIGLGIVYCVEMVQDIPRRLQFPHNHYWESPRIQTTMLIGVAVVFAVLNLADYTQDYLPKQLVYGERTVNLNVTARAINMIDDIDQREILYLSSSSLNLSGSNLTRYQTQRRGVEYMKEYKKFAEYPPDDYAFVAAADRYDDLLPLIEDNLASQLLPVVSQYNQQTVAYILLLTKDE
ncbi:MAG: glycosyltransferase family 39 protein [Anaerolineales bacterium]|nr:glycosyltransferase family 39 protein [Anaerolineales bacterium]